MRNLAVPAFLACVLLVACKNSGPTSSIVDAAPPAPIEYNDPPIVDAGISIERAYAAIPHRRTIWMEANSTVPPEEQAYLRVIFEVLDEGVALRVAGLQNYSNRVFHRGDIDGNFDRLIAYVQGTIPPKSLVAYHQDILTALYAERQFFVAWKTQGTSFAFADQISRDPNVQKASTNLRAAYGVLMAKYPQEAQANKDAFFDYHCALDFL